MLVPLFIFALFGYAVVTVDKATEHGAKPIEWALVKEEIDADLDDVKEAYDESTPVDYSKFND